MKKYTYSHIDIEGTVDIVPELNHFGANGWQLVGIIELAKQVPGRQQASEYINFFRCIMMREVKIQ